MSSDPDLTGTYESARAITPVWMMNMGGAIPIEVISEFDYQEARVHALMLGDL